MEVSVETLRTTIGNISDEELLRRWGAELFTEDALPIAEAELIKRGLDFSHANIECVVSEQTNELRESRSARYVQLLHSAVVAAGCAGFALSLGLLGVVIGGALAWPFGKWIAKVIDGSFDALLTRVALGFVAVLFTLISSLVISLLAGSAFSTSS